MKISLSKLLFFLVFTSLPVGLSAQLSETNNKEEGKFPNVEFIRPNKFTSLPSFIRFKKDNQFKVENLQSWMVSHFKFDSNMGFLLLKSETDNLGHIHYRYQQTYLGKPIEDAIWIAHTNNGTVYSLNGMIYSEIVTPKTAGLTEATALEKGLEFIDADVYKWEMAGEEEHLKWESGDNTATYLPKGELVFVAERNDYSARSYRLAYKFNIYAHAPLYRAELYIDANSGKIIREDLMIHHADTPGTAHTAYSGEQDIIADSFDGQFRLRDASRGLGVRTFDLNQATDFGSAVDFVDTDNNWNNINPQLDEYATDAHWGSEKTYDYYLEVHGRNSIDNAGFQLNNYVHYGTYFYNAFWDGSRMTFGDGTGAGITPLTTIDISAHEVTHGLTEFTAGLVYAAESGALNESFSDIFGTAIENYSRPDDWDWLIGAEIGDGGFRSMSNPNLYSCPDTYFGDYWADLDGWDSGGVHTNSGIQNHWYYLLTEGGSGTNDNGDSFSVSAAGIEVASAVAFRNLTVYLISSSQFADARFYAIQSAADLYGGCTFEVMQTANAWYAVGVGDEFDAEVIAEFSAPETESCDLPFTVTFGNESINGVDYLWDFGDGGTSTETFPTHTYTTEGEFTVTLTVDGGDCGDDEKAETGFIIIDTSIDCPIDFPTTGISSTSRCSGTLYDSGGVDEDYGPLEAATMVISPSGASTVELTFSDFDIENHATCNYDYLNIYDGPDVDATLIGKYCNSNIPTVISSTGPSITLYFYSDEYIDAGGFKIEWSCQLIDDTGIDENKNENSISIYPNPTNDNFTIDTRTIKKGTIEITDITGRKIANLQIKGSLTQIDISRFNAKGIYLVYIRDEKGELLATEKVVIN